MTELFIIELELAGKLCYVTACSKLSEIAATIRPHTYTHAVVHHWQRHGTKGVKQGWSRRSVAPWS